MKKEIEIAINEQMNKELYSAYLYLSMASYLESSGLPGFANWMQVQFEEEQFHALKLYNYVCERGGRVILKAIDAPPTEWDSVKDVIEKVFEHEQYVTGLINDLVDLAIAEKDHATSNMLQWYINEQVEEEASVQNILDKLNIIDDKSGGLFMLDKELGERVFTPPAA